MYLTQGRPEAAEPVFMKQLRLQPDSVVANVGLGRTAVEARLGLASLLRRSGRLQESLSQYEQLIQTPRAISGDPRQYFE